LPSVTLPGEQGLAVHVFLNANSPGEGLPDGGLEYHWMWTFAPLEAGANAYPLASVIVTVPLLEMLALPAALVWPANSW
jgi:hypothetical protein